MDTKEVSSQEARSLPLLELTADIGEAERKSRTSIGGPTRKDYFDTLSKEEMGIEEGGSSNEQRKEARSLPCSSTNHSNSDAQEGTPATVTATCEGNPILSKMMNSLRSGVFTAREPRPRD
ncbi:hypothetical protein FEM48_Zijuj07G0104600 [Ziziphus jujuba var. spinosa]|uniref:Uncharacterized protein n=1 Tax=Ziziphus jujuba var. spinosa TaxID=714518 RepID=A0A978V440_ZIZJJ|nr:hypothetical protein FEM48_Zijuj07G0104600 [Ziziphus jujuba var. spinosa]